MIFSDLSLAQQLERTEARCNVGFVEARKRLFPDSNARWLEVAGTYAMFDGLESPLTQTFGLGVFGEVRPADLDQLEAFFGEYQAPVLHEVSPLAHASLLPLLQARGYFPLEYTSLLYQPLDQAGLRGVATNPRITTRPIAAGEEERWARTSARGWDTEMPGLADFMFDFGLLGAQVEGAAPFIAEIDGEPIAAGGLFIYDGVALLAGASTVPEGRRQGGQLALLDARLHYAAAQGCTLAIMGALPGSASQRNAEKNGFRIAYTRTKWQLQR